MAVHSVQRTDRAWSVTLAARYADGSVRYFAVPVLADASGASFTVSGAPGVAAGPARTEQARSPYTAGVRNSSRNRTTRSGVSRV
ncbi:hypothetical protein ABT147_35550 [Streptomyces sp. NPDC001868]|uniref:hypothetical protein n=1 Tax=Streptomyces sp. NPDC001868 TaxID=3154401 RepID=UPI00332F197A